MEDAGARAGLSERATLSPWAYGIAAVYFAAHMLTATHYGYFRDALYYLACSEHLAWGYVDQPPLIILVVWLVRHTIGTSLPALLLIPALAGVGRILLTAIFARDLGAGRFGTALAAMLAATPAVWYVIDHQIAMNALEPLFWTGCAYVILRMIQTGDPKWWLAFGLLSGLGLQNKYSMAAFAFALIAGLLISAQRKYLFTPWILAGGALALLVFLPNLIWNVQHHWPFLELMRNIRASGRDVALSPGEFVAQQVLLMTPFNLPLWLGGLAWYLFSRDAKAYRLFGWTFLVAIVFFLLAHGKNYYSAPAYPIVLAAGGRFAEAVLTRLVAKPKAVVALKAFCFVWLFAGIGLLLPVVLPVLPIDAYLRYQEHLPFAVPRSEHSHMAAALPQHYADEFGWEEMVAATARIYHSLSQEEQAKTAIFANNYGQAGAIDFFGPKYDLPKAISSHQSFFLWGPRHYTGEIVIVLGSSNPENDRQVFRSVVVAARLDNPYALPYETRPILLCRGLNENLQTTWPDLKKWD